jgi:hypothetical protein
MYIFTNYILLITIYGRFLWPRRLKRETATALLRDFEFESHRGHEYPSVLSVVCCQEDVSATGQSFVQRGPTECSVSGSDIETSKMSKPRPSRAVEA